MNKDWELTEEQFNGLLDWLDSNRDNAARKYALIQLRLVRFFAARGCVDAEDLSDRCINIVTTKLEELRSYVGDPALYFLGVAKYVLLEYQRKIHRPPPPPTPPPDPEPDPSLEICLKRCVSELPPDDQVLVFDYEEAEKQARIQKRKHLATDLGITINALRIKIFRLHKQLRECIEQCLADLPAQ
jgi:DNA-directed RNA polymerase specialized sigma24 family protein